MSLGRWTNLENAVLKKLLPNLRGLNFFCTEKIANDVLLPTYYPDFLRPSWDDKKGGGGRFHKNS